MADKEVVIAVKFEFCCCSLSTRDLDCVATFSDQQKGHPISKMIARAYRHLNPPPNVDLPIKLTLQSGYKLTQGPFVDPASESDASKAWTELADRAIPGRVAGTELPGLTVIVSLYTHGEVVAQQLMQCCNDSNKNCAEFLYFSQQWKEQSNYWVLKALVHTFQVSALFIVDRIEDCEDRDTGVLMRRVLQLLLIYSDAQTNTKPESSSSTAVSAAVWNNAATELLHRRGMLDLTEVVEIVIDLLDVHLKADNQMKHLIKLLPDRLLYRNQRVIEALVSKAPRDHISLFEQGLLPGEWKSNASVMLAAVKNDHVAFYNDVDFELREDPEFVRDCIQASPPVMQYVRNPMMQIVFEKYPGFDEDIMHVPYAQVHLSPRWTETNRDFVADAIKHNPERLKYAPFQLRSDLEFAGRAVELGASLEHAGRACIADPGFVHKAVRLNGLNIRFVPEASVSLDLALEAVKQLQTTTDALWAAVQSSPVTDGSSKDGAVTAYCDHRFVVRIGINEVFKAVKHHFSDFKMAANAVLLCRGYDVCMQDTRKLIQMWPSSMLDNIEMAKFVAGLQIPNLWTHNIRLFSDRIRSDGACMRALVEAAGDPFMREVANKATHQFFDSGGGDSCVFMQLMKYAAPELWNDRDLVLKVLSLTTNKRVLQLLGPELRADSEVVELACTTNPLSVQWASKEQQTLGRVLNAVVQDGSVLRKLSSEWQRDFKTCLAAVKQEQLAFKYVHHTLLNNGKFVLEAMSVVRDFDFVWRTYVSAKLRRNRGGFYKQCMSAWQKGAANNAH